MTHASSPTVQGRYPKLSTRDFDRLYQEPDRRQRSAHFLAVARRREAGAARWGISVQARLGSAVVRNRLKRRIRAILRRAALQLPSGWDVAIQPRSAAVATADFMALTEELEALLKRTVNTEATK